MDKWQAMFAPDGVSDDLAKLRFELSRAEGAKTALEDYLFSLWSALLSKARHADGSEERLYWLTMAESLAELSGSVFGLKDNGKPATNVRNLRV